MYSFLNVKLTITKIKAMKNSFNATSKKRTFSTNLVLEHFVFNPVTTENEDTNLNQQTILNK